MKSIRAVVIPVVLLGVLVRGTFADDPMKAVASALKITLTEPQANTVFEVGKPFAVKAILQNVSDGAVAIPIGGVRISSMTSVSVVITHFPNGPAVPSGAIGPGGGHGGGNGVPPSLFVTIQPGDKIEIIDTEIVPMVPGDLELVAGFGNLESKYRIDDGKGNALYVPMPKAWTGSVYAELNLRVPNALSPEAAKQLQELKDVALQEAKPLAERVKALSAISDRRHYFAARAVIDIWKAGKGEFRDTALKELIKLFEVGTAYEAFPDMIAVLSDASAPEEMRLKLLSVFGKMNLDSNIPGISIGLQGYFDLSKEQVAQAVAAINAVAAGDSPRLAAAAKQIALP